MTKGAPQKSMTSRLLANGLLVAALIAWYVGSQRLPHMILPDPVTVARRLGTLLLDGAFLLHVAASLSRVLIAVAIALLLGGLLAILQKSIPVLEYPINRGILPLFNSFPAIGWTILAAIWFEPGHLPIIFVETAILLPFCLINIAEGLENIDAEVVEMGRSFTTHKPRILVGITLPLLAPYISGALRIAYGVGWKISLVAELIGSTSGVGYVMLRAESSADAPTLIACCLVVLALYFCGEKLLIGPVTRLLQAPQQASPREGSALRRSAAVPV